MELLLTATATSIMGFIAGLLTLRKTERFCPRCGVTNTCPIGHTNDAHPRYDDQPRATGGTSRAAPDSPPRG